MTTVDLAVLDTKPTGRDSEVTHSYWDKDWLASLERCRQSIPEMTGEQLARTLRWGHEHDTYYHADLCEFLAAAVEEAAKRLERMGEEERRVLEACDAVPDHFIQANTGPFPGSAWQPVREALQAKRGFTSQCDCRYNGHSQSCVFCGKGPYETGTRRWTVEDEMRLQRRGQFKP